ncbi:MAG: GNAT family N-acetyltransferase [Schleiferiaceae bacterium]|nr:GNAT family N-acetyltransferase [Schleiferiaceae bacterium]
MKIAIINSENLEPSTIDKIADFLYVHLDAYGDKREDIVKCLEYALVPGKGQGGFAVVGQQENEIKGAVVINHTGMSGFIPEHILVYIAMHKDTRGKGFGKQLMQTAIAEAPGNIALHVEPNNPAKFLYEKLGFTNKYLEMRLNKQES